MKSIRIKDYENYELFENGDIYSHKTRIFMKQITNYDGYFRICLCKNNKKKIFQIHRLLALHFIPNPLNLPCVDHIDRNRQNNDFSNLRWVTVQQNNCNTSFRKNNKLKHKHISKTKYNTYEIKIGRFKRRYFKTCKTLQQAIIQRDLMLSMFLL